MQGGYLEKRKDKCKIRDNDRIPAQRGVKKDLEDTRRDHESGGAEQAPTRGGRPWPLGRPPLPQVRSPPDFSRTFPRPRVLISTVGYVGLIQGPRFTPQDYINRPPGPWRRAPSHLIQAIGARNPSSLEFHLVKRSSKVVRVEARRLPPDSGLSGAISW